MASTCGLDAWGWITNLPAITQWSTDSVSLCIWSSESIQPSVNLSITRSLQSHNSYVTFSISADIQVSISLWTSNSLPLESKNHQPFSEETIIHLFFDIINGVLSYGPKKRSSFRMPPVQIDEDFTDIFNSAFLTLTLLVCIYEAPQELRLGCTAAMMDQITSCSGREATKLLVRSLGANLEQQWMRSLNLATTNWMLELQPSDHSFKTPFLLFSYAISASGLWKVQLYCPITAMAVEGPSSSTRDNNLLFSLNYQQLEGVIQLAYKVIVRENWIDVVANIDNIRCDVNPLVSETLMAKQGNGHVEKYFPSRISLQLTPTLQADVLSVSVSRSSDNPVHEVGREKGIQSSFDPPNSLGLKVLTSETVTVSMKPWKFEQSVYGNSANLNWILHDDVNGQEVFSSKTKKCTLLRPREWFRNRYSSTHRAFTKQGGVIFAGDEYGESVWWKVCGEAAEKKTMEWEIKGQMWLTYWPNKHRSFHSETRSLQFSELVYIPIAEKV